MFWGLAMLPAGAQVPIGSQPTTAVISPRQHVPRRVLGLHPDRAVGYVTVSESTNWSGYAVTGSSFTHAMGSWTVPAVACGRTPNAYAAFWVGIDGWTSNTVEQTGTDSDCNGDRPSYYAWYEFFPAGAFLITSVPISPGNRMSAQVTYNGSEFTIKITNETTGKSFSKSAKVAGAKRSSAEWIAEAPCCTNSGGILPLSDFSKVSLGEDYTDVNDTNYAENPSIFGPISDFHTAVQESIMVSSEGVQEAVPSSLTTDGASFKVTWKSE
jgi:Peptidase A4 family